VVRQTVSLELWGKRETKGQTRNPGLYMSRHLPPTMVKEFVGQNTLKLFKNREI